MSITTYEKGKWSDLAKELERVVRENNSKSKEERKSLSVLFKEFAEEHNTTASSAGFYYYNDIKPKLKLESSLDIDESISNYAKSELKDPRNVYKIGDIIDVEIVAMQDFGVFAKTREGFEGLIHISEITGKQYVDIPEDYFYIGENVKVKVKRIDNDGKIGFSTRALGGKEKINPAFKDIAEANIISEQKNKIENESEIMKTETIAEEMKTDIHPNDRDNIIQFIKKYSDNNVSQQALSDIDEMFTKYGIFQTTISLMEAVRDLDISSFITRITKEKLEGECLRRS